VIGEVAAAAVLAQTGNWVSHWGFNQYMIVHGSGSAVRTYHVAVVSLVFGIVGAVIVAAGGSLLGPALHAPSLPRFVPGLVLAVLIRRVGAIADKVLVREMRFRELAIANGAGDVAYTVGAISLAAATPLGGMAIVIANIVQSLVTTTLIVRSTGLGWLQPSPWRWAEVRHIFEFGVPLGVAHLVNYVTRSWDNLAIGAYFGPRVVGFYNMAYNLADVPAVQVGEQLTAVLFPAMSKTRPEDRAALMVRSTGLMAVTVFPMAVGLGVVAPSLIDVLLNDQWQGVAVVRPLSWSATTYLSSLSRNRAIMTLEVFKLVLLFALIVAFAPLGPYWTAGAVGIAFGLQAIATATVVIVSDGIPAWGMAMAACALMAAAVLSARAGLERAHVSEVVLLAAEVVVGAVAYIPAALLTAPEASREVLRLSRGLMPGTAKKSAAA
jgi:PST family polysaccharide transporter